MPSARLPVRIYDTRKTTPGWRRLEKYAVRLGGGWNHRLGLFDAVLIKDNHLAVAAAAGSNLTPAEAVRHVRQFLNSAAPNSHGPKILEVEVDTLEQLRTVLPTGPDLVLLDNMPLDQLRGRRSAQYLGADDRTGSLGRSHSFDDCRNRPDGRRANQRRRSRRTPRSASISASTGRLETLRLEA